MTARMIPFALFLVLPIFCVSQTTLLFNFDTSESQDDWEQYRLGAEEDFYLWDFSINQGVDGSTAMTHFYPVGGQEVTDDWFVSPPIDLSSGGVIDSIWHKYAGFGTPFGVDTVALYLLEGNADPALASEQTLLHLFSNEDYMNDNIGRKTFDISIPPSTGTSAYIAFRYKTIVNWLDVAFDDIVISLPLGIGEESIVKRDVFPNPVRNDFQLSGPQPDKVELIDIHGAFIKDWPRGNTSYSLSGLSSGLYFLRVFDGAGFSSIRLVVE